MVTAAPPSVSTAAAPPGPARATEHPTRLDIQGLRAVAILLVVASHAKVSGLSGGFVGVDVFFVVSGFLITSLLARELTATGRLSIRRFYARRALRLLPVSILVLLVTVVGARLYLTKLRFTEYAYDALSSVGYAVNFRLASSETDYFNEGESPSPFQHFWSLAVEEQFYVVWPLLLLLSWKLARRRLALIAVPLAGLCLASFWLSLTVTDTSETWAYFGSHTRAWELGAGALLALAAARLTRLPAALAVPMSWAGLGLVLLAALQFDEGTPFPGHHALLPVLGTVLILAGGCAPARGDVRLVLAPRPVTWIGGLSYGWYLWHWPLLLIGPEALDRSPGTRLSLALSAVALLLAWATLHLVENPVRFHPALRNRPYRGLGVGIGLTAGAAALALTAAALPPPIDAGAKAPETGAELAPPHDVKDPQDPLARLAELIEESGDELPSNLAPPLGEIRDSRSLIYEDGCYAAYAESESGPCVYGHPEADRTVVVFGDSHAAQWFPALHRAARENGWRLVNLTKASCKVALVTILNDGAPYETCDTWRITALNRIRDLSPDLVIAASAESGKLAYPGVDPQRTWLEGYQTTFQELRNTGAEVAYIHDTAWVPQDPIDCAANRPLDLDSCAPRLPGDINDQERRDLIEEAGGNAGVTMIDPLPWVCTSAGYCPLVVGNVFVYRDNNHLTDAYSEVLAPVLDQALTGLGGWGEDQED